MTRLPRVARRGGWREGSRDVCWFPPTPLCAAKQPGQGNAGELGLFARGLLGLEREAAESAFAGFREGRDLSGRRGRFVLLMVDSLERNGMLEVGALYESPFNTLAPNGPEDLFGDEEIDALMDVLAAIQATAVPAERSRTS